MLVGYMLVGFHRLQMNRYPASFYNHQTLFSFSLVAYEISVFVRSVVLMLATLLDLLSVVLMPATFCVQLTFKQ